MSDQSNRVLLRAQTVFVASDGDLESIGALNKAVEAAVAVALAAKGAQIAALRGENADLKTSVVAFLAPWAVRYAKDYELDGLHPTHYDILEKCGARMVDFKRAALEMSGGVL